jgi:hypothetical protein
MTVERSGGIVPSPGLQCYFREQVTHAARNQGVRVTETTEFYVVNLLCEFMSTRRLYGEREGGRSTHEPLALMWKRALESGPDARIPILKRLGDLSLYVSGFFHASLSRRMVDVDYYIAMGGNAYDTVASLVGGRSGGDAFQDVYAELSDKFKALVDVLGEVAESSSFNGSQRDLLRLYERWLRTGSRRLAARLAEMGVVATGAADPTVVH